MEPWSEYIRFGVSLLAVLDPLAAIPVFLTLTANQTPRERAMTANMTAISVFAVLTLSALGGDQFLRTMGASMDSFRVGGGIVLMLLAVEMLRAQTSAVRQTPEEAVEAGQKATVAVVPLGIPLLAGPGAISAVIIEMDRVNVWPHAVFVMTCIAIMSLLTWATLRLAAPIGRRLGRLGINIANRLLGLVLAAIAVEIMAGGLRGLFPSLGA